MLFRSRQAARDKAHSEADAQHREALAIANEERQASAAQNTQQLLNLMQQNTELTALTKGLTERIERLTVEIHGRFLQQESKL